MALTEGEARRLREIEADLQRDDPRLVNGFGRMRTRRPRLFRRGLGTLLVSIPLLVAAGAWHQLPLYLAAWAGLLAGATMIMVHCANSPGGSPPL
jgi:hypothetical protein